MPVCPDCGEEWGLYIPTQAEHDLSCDAKTCSMCLNVYPEAIKEEDEGGRICKACRRELDAGGYDRDSEEEEEPDGIA